MEICSGRRQCGGSVEHWPWKCCTESDNCSPALTGSWAPYMLLHSQIQMLENKNTENISPQALRGGSTSSAYTNGAITTCSQGFTILSPYGFIYKPGSCYDYSLTANSWEDTGARLTSFRRGATITKLGR